MADGVMVRLLGPVRVRGTDGTDVVLRGHAAHLLAWLALHPGRAWPADDLARRLWPGGPPPTARTAIQGHVSRLRRMLGDGGRVQIETVPGGYMLRTVGNGTSGGAHGTGSPGEPGSASPGEPGTTSPAEPDGDDRPPVDAHRFTALCTRAAHMRAGGCARGAVGLLEAALALWSGDALAQVRGDPELAAEAAALDDERRSAEDALADALVAAGEIERALALLGRLVNDDPLRERRWALLMIALTRAGRQTDALRAYRRAAAVLVERTGLDPGHELRRLETAILLQDASLDAARWQPAPGRAPVPLTGVVGRDAERAAVVTRLSRARVVTITGPGGIGKSTVAVDVGAAMADTLGDGVVVVELGTGGPDDVGTAVAAALNAPVGDGGDDDPLARAVAVLEGREVVVILDGCEHVGAEAARVAVRLVQAGPGVRVLATSQVPLGVSGESVVTLGPLELPPEGAEATLVRQAPAAQLLARRLDDIERPIDDDTDWLHVATIVRALDGVPLAIEIVAAAARTESLAGLAERLVDDTSVVLDAAPPAGAGHRRLGAALDATVGRLDAEAARLYAHLSVFPGTFGAAEAAAVAGRSEGVTRRLIGALADSSLIVPDGSDRARGRLLHPVRAHAATRLAPADRTAGHERLVAWCTARAVELDRSVHSPAQVEVIERFMATLPTFRIVLRWLLDRGDIERAATLFQDLVPSWGDSPASPEAATWAEELLAHADRLEPGPRARLEVAALHCVYAFELVAARLDMAEQTLARAESVGDRFTAAAAQLQVAVGLGWRNLDLDRAGSLLDASRATMLALGSPHWAAVALELRGLLALRRLDVVAGIALLEEAAAEHRAGGSSGDVAHALTFIGYARRAVGDLGGARRAFDEARLVLGRGRVSTWLRASVGAAHAALALGDADAASGIFREAHDRAVEVGDHRIAGTALVGLATIARDQGADDRCVALLRTATDGALAGGDPTDAVTAAGVLAEMLVARGAPDEAALVLGATDLVEDQVGVRVDFGLARDLGPVRASVVDRLGEARAADMGRDGRLIGLAAAVRRAGERLLGDTDPGAHRNGIRNGRNGRAGHPDDGSGLNGRELSTDGGRRGPAQGALPR
jgi:predicted ATPase/DNA-binding SARP family transcriptional activator